MKTAGFRCADDQSLYGHRDRDVLRRPRQLRLVLAWAELHQDELLENWRLARAGERLREIEPLR